MKRLKYFYSKIQKNYITYYFPQKNNEILIEKFWQNIQFYYLLKNGIQIPYSKIECSYSYSIKFLKQLPHILRFRNSQVFVGFVGHFSSSWSTDDKPFLN